MLDLQVARDIQRLIVEGEEPDNVVEHILEMISREAEIDVAMSTYVGGFVHACELLTTRPNLKAVH